MDINEAVASQLRAERASARLTMDEVAARGVISKSTLVRYEKAEREIPVAAIAALAQVYGVTVRSILNAAMTRMEEAHARNVEPEAPRIETHAGTTGNVVEWSRPPHAPSQVRARGARGTTPHRKA